MFSDNNLDSIKYKVTRRLDKPNELVGKTNPSSVIFEVIDRSGNLWAYKMMKLPETTELVEKLRNEITQLMKLNHLNIVQIYEGPHINPIVDIPSDWNVSWRGPRATFLMTLGEKSLFDYFETHVPSDLKTNMNIFNGIASGLQYLHSKKILHGSIEPSNIILDSMNIPMLSDFGLSSDLGDLRVGKSMYAAPEMRRSSGFSYSHRSDIYSLGVILVQFFTEKEVFYFWMHGPRRARLPIPHVNFMGDATANVSIAKIADQILQIKPFHRITTDKVVIAVDAMLKKM